MTNGAQQDVAPVWSREIEGPTTRAFVVGVGAYPLAKPGKGHDPWLRSRVQDVACAAASARRIADWLVENADRLTPRLSSLYLLVGDPPPDPLRLPYAMTFEPQAPVLEPTKGNFIAAGTAWAAGFKEGDSAFCFASGHGALRDHEAVVFLSDLNGDAINPWGAHFNVSATASAFKQRAELKAAHFFTDACQELSTRFQLTRTSGAEIVRALDPFDLDNAVEKVSLVCSSSAGMLSYEGDWPAERDNMAQPSVTIGRFTQLLVEALDGASVRRRANRWLVEPSHLARDISMLHDRRIAWTEPFQPVALLSPTRVTPIVEPSAPRVPVFAMTDPERRMADYRMEVLDHARVRLANRVAGDATLWIFDLEPSVKAHSLVASNDMTSHEAEFAPSEPVFDQRVVVS